MNTMYWGPALGRDAASRPYDPQGVYYTGTDVMGLFADAVARGEPPNGEIVEYYREYLELGICAFVRNKESGEVTLYGMDVKTGRPYPVFPTPGEPPPRRKRRPRFSREWKIREAARKWYER